MSKNYLNTHWLCQRYEEAKNFRAPLESDYRLQALHCLPAEYPLWNAPLGGVSPSGAATARAQVFDSTARKAIPKWATICHRLLTPKSQIWHKLQASNPELMRIRAVQLYFGELNSLLWRRRYDPKARFGATQTEVYTHNGVYGTGVKYVAARERTVVNRTAGLAYRSIPFRDVFVLVDEWNNIYAVFRRFWLNARQTEQKFAKDGDKSRLPQAILSELSRPSPSENRKWEFFQAVLPRDDFDAERMDARRWPLASVYVCVEEKCQMAEPSGYNSYPFIVSRFFPTPDSPYGLAPAHFVLPAMGGASAMKKTLLKQGQKAVDPPLLAHDDGVVNGNVDQRPGAINFGGVDSNGRELIKPLQPGNFQWGDNLLQDERSDIEDAFFIRLFQILVETPEMTATEVMERVAEKSSLLAPTMEMMQSEDAGPNIEREIDVLGQLNMLPEMPPELIEARGEYEVIYTSPLAKQQNAEQIAGFSRIVDMAVNAAAATQNSRPLRRINFDTAIPDIADTLSVPPTWLHSDEEVEALAAQDQAAADVEQLSQAAPAMAGLMKAQAGAGKRPAP